MDGISTLDDEHPANRRADIQAPISKYLPKLDGTCDRVGVTWLRKRSEVRKKEEECERTEEDDGCHYKYHENMMVSQKRYQSWKLVRRMLEGIWRE